MKILDTLISQCLLEGTRKLLNKELLSMLNNGKMIITLEICVNKWDAKGSLLSTHVHVEFN